MNLENSTHHDFDMPFEQSLKNTESMSSNYSSKSIKREQLCFQMKHAITKPVTGSIRSHPDSCWAPCVCSAQPRKPACGHTDRVQALGQSPSDREIERI